MRCSETCRQVIPQTTLNFGNGHAHGMEACDNNRGNTSFHSCDKDGGKTFFLCLIRVEAKLLSYACDKDRGRTSSPCLLAARVFKWRTGGERPKSVPYLGC